MNCKFYLPLFFLLLSACAPQPWTETDHGTYRTVHQKGAPVLGYSPASGASRREAWVELELEFEPWPEDPSATP